MRVRRSYHNFLRSGNHNVLRSKIHNRKLIFGEVFTLGESEGKFIIKLTADERSIGGYIIPSPPPGMT